MHDTTEPLLRNEAESTTVAVVAEIDRASLTQALLDFEVANARVLDLTARVVEANQRVRQLHHAAETARAETDAQRQLVSDAHERAAQLEERIRSKDQEIALLSTQLEEARRSYRQAANERDSIKASRTYKAARGLASVRRLLR